MKITSLQNTVVKHLVRLRLEEDYRAQEQVLVLEGAKIIEELAPRGALKKIFYTQDYAERALAIPGSHEKIEVTEEVLQKISGLRSPEGIVAEVAKPLPATLSNEKRVLALDGVSDPGNVGTLLRTALGFGWEAVVFLPGSCDPFNEKVLRSARGAHFKLHLSQLSHEELLAWVAREKVEAWVADLNGSPPEAITSSSQPRLLVLGHEGHGPSSVIKKTCRPVSLPMQGDMESLNVAVAGGILLYTLGV